MAAPFTTLTITQGATSIEIDIHAAHSLNEGDQIFGGFTTRRAANGRAIKQTHWAKRRIPYTGSGAISPALFDLDFSAPMVLASPSLRGSPLSVFADPPQESRDVHGAAVSWSITFEES